MSIVEKKIVIFYIQTTIVLDEKECEMYSRIFLKNQ